MTVLAAVLRAPDERFRVQPVELEPPREREVLVKVRSVGVCHSDWHVATGATKHPMPCVAGHEGSGVVEAVGKAVSKVEVGDLVALNWAPSCGQCFYCRVGRPALCAAYTGPIWAGTMIDGTTRLSREGAPIYHYCGLACLAERCVVPEASCVRMPPQISADAAALIGCAVATGVGAVLNTARVSKGSSVAVFGAGGVGLSVVMGAKLAGANPIIAVDSNSSKRSHALGVGADAFVDSGPGVASEIRAATEGRGADFAFEAVGLRAVQETAFDCIRPGGTLVIAGLSPMGEDTSFPAARLVREEKTVMGTYYGTCDAARDFPRLADWFLEGALPIGRLVTKTYELDEVEQAYADMRDGAVARGVIRVSSE